MDGRKRLSGAQYKKNANLKQQKILEAVKSSKRIDAFFSKSSSNASSEVQPSFSGSESLNLPTEAQVSTHIEEGIIQIFLVSYSKYRTE